MHVLVKVEGNEIGPSDGQSLPIPPQGLVFVGTKRPSHNGLTEDVVELADDTVTSGTTGHCRVWLQGGAVFATDNGSDNGTWLLGTEGARRLRSTGEAVELRLGSVLQIGRSRFRLSRLAEYGPSNQHSGE
jgi:hypothetical protein